jgi:hypothetical protein
MKRLFFLCLSLVALGCDGLKSIGDGNGVLLVNATADFDGNQTRVRVDVFRNGQQLDDTNAIVQVAIGEDGALQGVNFQGNRFEIDLNGYTQELRLAVNSASDNVDVVFDGPDLAVIDAPTAGQTVNVSQGEDLRVEWSRGDRDATQVRISTQGFNTTLLEEPGSFTIPFFDVDIDADEVTVERTNVALLDGGADGSTFRISAETKVGFNAQ